MPKPKRLNDVAPQVLEKNLFKELPDYDACPEAYAEEKVIITNHIPEYRKVVFVNQKDPGCEVTFHHKTKTHPMKQYTLFHGKEYDLPVEIIESLEKCGIPLYGKEIMTDKGFERPIIGYSYHYSFRSPSSSQRVA